MRWQNRAACAGEDPGLFFPDPPPRGGNPNTDPRVRAARAICATCPVREPCLELGLSQETAGPSVWGGEYFSQRRLLALRKRQRSTAA